jgi:hypothetical protein
VADADHLPHPTAASTPPYMPSSSHLVSIDIVLCLCGFSLTPDGSDVVYLNPRP